jgi:signal peptidase
MEGEAAVKAQNTNSGFLKRVTALLANTAFILTLVLMAVLVISLLQSRFTGGPPTIAGHRLYVVLSGSMSPAFEAGSLVVVRPAEAEEIAVGDIITYREPGEGAKLTTHRVVEVEDENGLQFITKGDANEVVDQGPVPAENLVGKVVFAIPYAGYVADFAQSPQGLVTLVIIPGILIIVFEARNLLRYAAELERQKLAGKAAAAGEGKNNEA